jgi:uncharacterized protein
VTVSCLYEGTVRHRRSAPSRQLQHPLALAYVDLDELPSLLGGRLVRPGFGPLRFRRSDYLGDPALPLATAVRELVRERTGRSITGPIRLLTQLRSFGVCFNPVSFYYCLDAAGARLEALIAEVTNTPWGERHAYVIAAGEHDGGVLRGSFDKQLHVSPFMGMDHRYTCSASAPGETLSVHIDSVHDDGGKAFDATLSMRRAPLNGAAVARLSVRYPAASARVLALIYIDALRLRLAGAPVFRHPEAGAA